MLDWTGERYLPFTDPKITGAEIHYEHLHRYGFAAQFVNGKDVLDLAFGEGYGSFMLSEKAKYVLGVEINQNSVAHAQSKYIRDNLEFKQGSILEIPLDGEKLFDVIVCFEAIEHVEDHDKLLSEVKRLLKDNGLFIVSTPNRKLYSDETNYANPYHVNELYYDEFANKISKYFSFLNSFGQKIYAGSSIWPLSSSKDLCHKDLVVEIKDENFIFLDKNEKVSLYFIIIASNTSLDECHNIGSHLIDISNVLINLRDTKISELSGQLENAICQMQVLVPAMAERDLQISELNANIQVLVPAMAERDLQISELNASMMSLEKEISDIRSSVLWQMTMRFHNCFVEQRLPHGTARRKCYDLLLKSCRILANDGARTLLMKYSERKRVKRLETILELQTKENAKQTITHGLEDIKMGGIALPNASEDCEVSIIIPVYNNAKFTYNCIKSLSEMAKGSFEVVVVDDASTDETPDLLKNIKNIKIIKNIKNQGFIESSNRGARSCKGKYILFLNNDTIVTDNWLEPLVETIKLDKVGAVGAKLIYPDGKLQEAGGIIWNDASGWNYGRGDDPDKPEYNFVREVDYCSGAALLVKKELFEKMGGLDERFKPAYYEDADLCFSIRHIGYKVLYQPRSTIVHFEGATSGTDITSGAKKYQDINKGKFFEKWSDGLQKEHYLPDSKYLFLARSHGFNKAILIIDQYVPLFDRDAGSCRMYNILKILIDLRYKVTFVGDNFARFDPYVSKLQQHGVEVICAPYIRSIDEYLSLNGMFFDIVILSRAHIASNHISKVRNNCRNAKILFDTVDLQFLRESRRAKVTNNEAISRDAEKLKELELRVAKASDVTLVVSNIEKEILMKEDPSLKVEVLSVIHSTEKPRNGFSDRRDLLFLGAFLHPPNVDAVRWFIDAIFPFIKEKIPGVKLYVVGDQPPKEIISLSAKDVIVTGYVENLTPYLENCKVFVAPLRYGAGVKGKINQSMSRGLPVVTTSIGAEGLGLVDSETALLSDLPEQFSKKVVNLYNNKELWDKISKNSINHVEDNFSYESSKKRIQSIIANL